MKKYFASILTASLLFGVSVRAEEVEKEETKTEDEIVKKIENKIATEENAPVVKEEAKNQNETSEEKSNVLAYTLATTGGVVAGWVGTCIARNYHEKNIVASYKKNATEIKTIFGMKKEDLEKKKAELEKEPKLPKSIIAKKIAICQKALDAQQNNAVEAELAKELNDLEVAYLNKNAENLIKKFDAVKAEVLKKEQPAVIEASASDGNTSASVITNTETKKDDTKKTEDANTNK